MLEDESLLYKCGRSYKQFFPTDNPLFLRKLMLAMPNTSCYKYISFPSNYCLLLPMAPQSPIIQQIGSSQILVDYYNQKKDIVLSFLLELFNSLSCYVIKQFQSHLTEVISNIEYLSAFCRLLNISD